MAADLAGESPEVVDEVSVIANTINALLGVSLFAMPWGFQQAGILGGVLILAIVATLSFDTARMLLVCQKYYYLRTGEVKSYPEIAGAALGNEWQGIVQLATIISCLGGCTGYMIFFGETVGQALSVSSHDVILIATVPIILLSWIRSFRELTIFTIFGVIALIIAVLVILYDGSQHLYHSHVSFANVPMFDFKSASNFLGPATFLFTIHYFTLSMGAETLKLKSWHVVQHITDDEQHSANPYNSAMSYSVLTTPIAISYFMSWVVIAIVGSAGYVMYRDVGLVTDHTGELLVGCEDHVCQNVILNLAPGIPRDIVGITMSLVIILSYILILAPAREHIERHVLRLFPPNSERRDLIYRNTLRTLVVLATIIVALKAPYFGSMMGAVGGLTDAVQCFVFPPWIFLKIQGDKLSTVYRYTCYAMMVWGAFIMLYTASSIFVEVLHWGDEYLSSSIRSD